MNSLPTFQIITGAHVCRILSEKDAQPSQRFVAKAVEYNKNRKTEKIHVGKEVIVYAGSYQMPQILELSGINDSGILQKFGISAKVSLPNVDRNLQVSAREKSF
uniref:Putative alcohol oxidase n=1 Tax=Moniliophthora roreri TaxID=221103 RepID=A0A0W0FJ18_MONRR